MTTLTLVGVLSRPESFDAGMWMSCYVSEVGTRVSTGLKSRTF